jgi:hypothetical protein
MNTINYVIKKNLIPLSYFDLFSDYPIIKSSSKRDCFIQFKGDSEIEILKNEDVLQKLEESKIETIYGEINSDFFEGIKIVDKVDYESIIRKVKTQQGEKSLKIEPLYIKKPNIS